MTVSVKTLQSIGVAGSLAIALSCRGDPAGPIYPVPFLHLSLTSDLGSKRDFFEGEPIYVAFSLTNNGSDTVWTTPFSFVLEWFLDGELTDSVGTRLYKWGGIATLIARPHYRGVPLAPGRSRYEVWMVQDRWGLYGADMENIYAGHDLPPGKYTLRMHFNIDALTRRTFDRILKAEPVTFRVHARDTAEDQSFHRVQALMAMAFSHDSLQRLAFGDSLLAAVQSRSPDDPFMPYLITGWGWAAIYWRGSVDSTHLNVLANAVTSVARAERTTAAGAYAVAGVNALRPATLRALGHELAGSLAGNVATFLADSLKTF